MLPVGSSALRKQLRVDPIACDGHGLCAELFPEWIALDDWGYPIIDARPVPTGLREHMRAARSRSARSSRFGSFADRANGPAAG